MTKSTIELERVEAPTSDHRLWHWYWPWSWHEYLDKPPAGAVALCGHVRTLEECGRPAVLHEKGGPDVCVVCAELSLELCQKLLLGVTP